MLKLPIYMDYHATTPVDPRVLEAMLPCFREEFGNAASRNHPFGWRAEKLVEEARRRVAHIIHADPKEIIFTSGATESNNLALKGVFELYREKGNHLVTQVTEHKSVLDTAKYLEKQGARVTFLPVDREGLMDLGKLRQAIDDKIILISVMAANNEIGALQPIAEIGKIAKEKGVLFHVDAAQAVGKIPVDVQKMGIDLLSFTSHKMYGPKGIGALYVRRKDPRVRLAPLIHGGGHEGGFRSGTLNVPAIVGFGKACEIAEAEMVKEAERILKLRTRLHEKITKGLDQVYLNGPAPASDRRGDWAVLGAIGAKGGPVEKRLPGNLNLSFAYVEGESLLMAINEEIAVSSGSACMSANPEPSYVLKALGIAKERFHSSIRFGLGRFTTEEEVDYAAKKVIETVKKLRKVSPLYDSMKDRYN